MCLYLASVCEEYEVTGHGYFHVYLLSDLVHPAVHQNFMAPNVSPLNRDCSAMGNGKLIRSREEGAITNVALDLTLVLSPCICNVWLTNPAALSKEPAIVDRITRVLPRPMSSATIPPLASLADSAFAPVIRCRNLGCQSAWQ